MRPTNQVEWLLDIYSKNDQRPIPKDVEKIKLSRLISKLGFFYEKFRNAIDYNEEHLVRRNSLERLLRREVLFLQEGRPQKISRTIIYEFIRARYLPNDTLPESIIKEVADIIKKYLLILSYINGHKLPDRQKAAKWLMNMAACEIDEYLIPVSKDLAIVNFMYSRMVDDIAFTRVKINEKEKNLQIYLSVLKTLTKADSTALRYRLLNLFIPNWTKLNEHEIHQFCKGINTMRGKIDSLLKHPLAFQLTRTVRLQSVFFTILREAIHNNPETFREIFDNPDTLEEKIEEICISDYHSIRKKLIGSIFRVIVYIFLTKTILAFIFELPYENYFLQKINWNALAINILFHPLLMFVVAMTIRVPSAKNTKIIVQEIKKIVYGEERKIVFKPKKSLKRGSFSYLVFNTIYLIMFAISFGIVFRVLRTLDFNILSGALFIFFLTAVSFFGFRLRALAKQLSVIPRKDSLVNFIFDFFSLPIIRVGKFLSSNFSKVNIFLYILDFIIETPIKLLIEFLEKTVSFVGEKREEIIE